MIIQLKKLFERPGDRMDLNGQISLEELSGMGLSIEFTSPISLNGRIQNLAGTVSLDYAFKTEVLHVCDRCLSEFAKSYQLNFKHILVRSESEITGDDDIVCDGLSIDMGELAVSDLLISLPTKILCREDCLGLCPDCGANLNKINGGKCGCHKNV